MLLNHVTFPIAHSQELEDLDGRLAAIEMGDTGDYLDQVSASTFRGEPEAWAYVAQCIQPLCGHPVLMTKLINTQLEVFDTCSDCEAVSPVRCSDATDQGEWAVNKATSLSPR